MQFLLFILFQGFSNVKRLYIIKDSIITLTKINITGSNCGNVRANANYNISSRWFFFTAIRYRWTFNAISDSLSVICENHAHESKTYWRTPDCSYRQSFRESTDHSIPYRVSDGANLIECLQHQMSLLVVEGLSYWSFWLANPPKSNRARPVPTVHANRTFLFSHSGLPEFNYDARSYDRLDT